MCHVDPNYPSNYWHPLLTHAGSLCTLVLFFVAPWHWLHGALVLVAPVYYNSLVQARHAGLYWYKGAWRDYAKKVWYEGAMRDYIGMRALGAIMPKSARLNTPRPQTVTYTL